MGFGKGRLSCKEARELDIVRYLSGLGHEPVRARGDDWWYRSPLREERLASFKVNRGINRWFDYGLWKGGNLVDFALAYHGCTVGEFLAFLQHGFSFHPPSLQRYISPLRDKENNGIRILTVKPLSHPALLSYVDARGIPIRYAGRHCREVHYKNNGKHYFVIGFRNNEGGYELRNAYFKGGSSPKGVTTITGGAKDLAVFEGFFDFLSFLALVGGEGPYPVDFLILNSLAFFENSLPLMEGYHKVRLFLDNDTAGQNCSRRARTMDSRFVDESGLYKNHKDLNGFLARSGNGRPGDRDNNLAPP